MIKIKCSCFLIGKEFNPDSISHLWTNLTNPMKIHRKGESSTYGRYKGDFYPDSTVSVLSEIDEVITFLEKVYERSDLSIEHIFIDLIVQYKNQCNFEITPDILMRISKFDLPLGITCYEDDIGD